MTSKMTRLPSLLVFINTAGTQKKLLHLNGRTHHKYSIKTDVGALQIITFASSLGCMLLSLLTTLPYASPSNSGFLNTAARSWCSSSQTLQDSYYGLQNPTYVIYELAPCQQWPPLQLVCPLFILPSHITLHEVPGTHHAHYCLGAFVLVAPTTWNVLPSDIHTSITFLFFRCLV